jgi:hypothetical protein
VCVGWLCRHFGARVLIFFLEKKYSFKELSSVPPSRGKKINKKPFRFLFNFGLLQGQGGLPSPHRNFTTTTTTQPAPTTSSRKFEKVKYPQR